MSYSKNLFIEHQAATHASQDAYFYSLYMERKAARVKPAAKPAPAPAPVQDPEEEVLAYGVYAKVGQEDGTLAPEAMVRKTTRAKAEAMGLQVLKTYPATEDWAVLNPRHREEAAFLMAFHPELAKKYKTSLEPKYKYLVAQMKEEFKGLAPLKY